MELVLIRHGHPLSEERTDGSPADPPLSEKGVAQARAVAKWLSRNPPTRLLSSPALRARQTASATAALLALEIVVDERLCDANPDLERYVTLEEEQARDPVAYRKRLADYQDVSHWAAVSLRINSALDEWTESQPGSRIAVFCHGSVINVYAARILGLAKPVFLDTSYASGHRFLISRSGIRSVKSLNETAYL